MFSVFAISGVLASLLAAPAPAAQPQLVSPPSERITISVVTVNGSGCPAGTASVLASSDNTTFTVSYSDYLAQVGPSADPTDFRKNCQLVLKVSVPQGFTFAIGQADYAGFASLASGASGLEQAAYYWQGNSETAYVGHSFSGPLNDDWQTKDVTSVAALVFAPCGVQRNLNVNTELRVNAGTSPDSATSFMAMDSTRVSVHTIYHLSWKQC